LLRPAWAILTETEMASLVKWVLACAANDNPAVEREVSEQVTKMLLPHLRQLRQMHQPPCHPCRHSPDAACVTARESPPQ